MTAIVLQNNTVVRANVIAQRTDSNEMAIVKAMMIEGLKDKMRNGTAHFVFIKRNGEVREAWGTLNATLVSKHTNGRGVSREHFATTAYFDIEAGGWRSFRWESLVWVE